MNFSWCLLIFILLGCGIKGDPTPARPDVPPSLMQNYPDLSAPNKLNDQEKPSGI